MDPSILILIAVAVVAIIATAGAFTIAFRRSALPSRQRPPERRRNVKRVSPGPAAPVAVPVPTPAKPKAGEGLPAQVTVVEVQRIVEVSPEEGGVTRRHFFNRVLVGMFGSFLAVLGTSTLAFLWPKLSGGFGTKVDAGPIEDIRAQLVQPDGTVTPFVVFEAKAYVVPITEEQLGGSQFDQPGMAAEGLMAMWWRCVHLGCRAPWCAPSAGFECPCHGSKYNLVGEYQAGPAPRNLDRFAVEVSADGRLIIDTGTIVQTPRAPTDTVPYPQGPSCISAL